MFSAADHAWMAHALRLAQGGAWTTHPNPRVGCVIVSGERLLGEGFHRRAGQAHAEVAALAAAGRHARGATCYVTLEPCAHQGRTPPCTEALIQGGVARVVIAAVDPNPAVHGRGIERLRGAGIEVQSGLLAADSRELNAGFFSGIERSRPWVRLKLAASIDGATAMASGESRWITGAAARADVQRWRARAAAVLTGIGTVLADDPRLNVRLDLERESVCVVVDSRWRLPATARLIEANDRVIWIGGNPSELPEWHADHSKIQPVPVPLSDGRVSLEAALGELAALEVNEVQVEAGSVLAGALLAAGLVDELLLYLAPRVLGRNTKGLFSLPALETMADRVNLQWRDVRAVGDDLRVRLRPES